LLANVALNNGTSGDISFALAAVYYISPRTVEVHVITPATALFTNSSFTVLGVC
jgi:hypothetical protein